MSRRPLLAAAALAALFVAAPQAQAARSLCIPSAPDSPVRTPDAAGGCGPGFTLTSVAESRDAEMTSARLARLERLLSGVSRTTAVGGKDTLTLSGMNLQVTNGRGVTQSPNGLGNVQIGYNEDGSVAGSHNLVTGAGNSAPSSGSVVGGFENRVGLYGAALGGWKTSATGDFAATVGGVGNWAENAAAAAVGGCGNIAGRSTAPVIAAEIRSLCPTAAEAPFVGGGLFGRSVGRNTVVVGGEGAVASGLRALAAGGLESDAAGRWSMAAGGRDAEARGSNSVVSGGYQNLATGSYSWLGGGLAMKGQASFTAGMGGVTDILTETNRLFPPVN